MVNGQFVHDLVIEEKHSNGTLKPPSDYCREETYAQIFMRLLRGQRADVIVEGANLWSRGTAQLHQAVRWLRRAHLRAVPHSPGFQGRPAEVRLTAPSSQMYVTRVDGCRGDSSSRE